MTSGSDKPKETSARPPRVAKVLWILDRAARLILIAVIGWLTFTLLMGFRSWNEVPEVVQETKRSAVAPPEALLSDFASGYWTFSGLSWDVHLDQFDTVEAVDEHLMSLPKSGSVLGDDEGAALATLLQQLGGKPTRSGEWNVYRLRQPTFRGVAFLRNEKGRFTLGAARIAYPLDARQWTAVDFLPARPVRTKEHSPLLPLPRGATSIATRFDKDGLALGEFVQMHGPLAGAIDGWRAQGWTVTEAPDSKGSEVQWICVRGAEAVYIWVGDLSRGGDKVLLVCRMPKE